MAKGRMIHTRLWDSEQFLSLTAWERLLYIALIVLADDEGCFRADPEYWQRKIFYGQKTGKTQIERMIQAIQETGLIVTGKAEKGFAGLHPNWHDYQTLIKARSKPSVFSDLLVAKGLTPRFGTESEGNRRQAEANEIEASLNQMKRNEDRRRFDFPDRATL